MVLGITQCIPNTEKVKLHNMLCHKATTNDPQIHCYPQSSIKNRKVPSFVFTIGSLNLSLPLLRKLLCELSNLLATTMGIVNKQTKSVGKLESVLFSNVNLPPFDSYNCFHPNNLHSFLQYGIPRRIHMRLVLIQCCMWVPYERTQI